MAWPIMRDYIELTKPRITWLILMSTGIGYFFGLPARQLVGISQRASITFRCSTRSWEPG